MVLNSKTMKTKRREEVVRNQLVFGTLPLGDLQYKLGKRKKPFCLFCEKKQKRDKCTSRIRMQEEHGFTVQNIQS